MKDSENESKIIEMNFGSDRSAGSRTSAPTLKSLNSPEKKAKPVQKTASSEKAPSSRKTVKKKTKKKTAVRRSAPASPANGEAEVSSFRKGFKGKVLSYLFPGRRDKWEFLSSSSLKDWDFRILIYVALLSLFGLIMVTSSGYYYAYTYLGDSLYFFKKQLLWLLIGLLGMIVAAFVSLKLVKKLSGLFYLLSVALCLLVLFFGEEVNGSTRWFSIGPVNFQPSELAKIALILYLSALMEDKKRMPNETGFFFLCLLIIAVPGVLILKENLTSCVILCVIGGAVLFSGNFRIRYFAILIALVAVFAAVFLWFPLYYDSHPEMKVPEWISKLLTAYMYRTDRLRAWSDPWKYVTDEGYQTVQALYAVGSGGFFGRGLGNGIQKLGFIPEAHNDIIFAVICEELGVVGAGAVILMFILLIYSGMRLASKTQNRFASCVAVGLTAQVGVQAVMNIAVNLNVIPTTGVSLPFISYGGTSLLFLMIGMGLLLNISGQGGENAHE